MAGTKIEWAHETWNPTTGCSIVSKECSNCYAKDQKNRWNHEKYTAGFDTFVQHENELEKPLKWKAPKTIFVNSMSDLFHEDATLEFIKKVFKVMNETPRHTYLVLTKRHHRLTEFSAELNWTENIYMGVSVGHEPGVRRIEHLVNSNAKKKFISVEPLIEELPDLDLKGIDLVIVGGESGGTAESPARPIKKEWILKVKQNCDDQKVPFFFKQFGKTKFNADQTDPTIHKHHRYHAKGGCMLDGQLYLSNPAFKDDYIPVLNLFDEEYLIMDQYEGLHTIWEIKSHLPFLQDDLYDQLKENIRLNGVNDPILYFVLPDEKKLVIDGHSRLKACIELKIKNIPTREVTEQFDNIDDIKLCMVKNQFHRRNLSNVEKLRLAFLSKDSIERMAHLNLARGGQQVAVAKPVDTCLEIAKIAGVGKTTVVSFKYVIDKVEESDKKSKSILNDLLNGNISISAAHKLMKEHVGSPQILPDTAPDNIQDDFVDISSDNISDVSADISPDANQDNSQNKTKNASLAISHDKSAGFKIEDAPTDSYEAPIEIIQDVFIETGTPLLKKLKIDEATGLLKDGIIKGIIILNDESQKDLFNQFQNEDYEFVFLN